MKPNTEVETYQGVLLPRGQVQRGVVQALHEVSETRHIHLVLHSLEEKDENMDKSKVPSVYPIPELSETHLQQLQVRVSPQRVRLMNV